MLASEDYTKFLSKSWGFYNLGLNLVLISSELFRVVSFKDIIDNRTIIKNFLKPLVRENDKHAIMKLTISRW